MNQIYETTKDKKVEKIMENILGINVRTKLEKLANSFSGVKYLVHPFEKNSETGFIEFAYTGRYFVKKNCRKFLQ